MTKKVFLVSHNKLAEGLKKSAEMIAGKQDNVYAYCLMEDNSPNGLIKELKQQIKKEDQVFLLADIVGGSMYNEAMTLLSLPNIKLIGGMNLSLLLNIILHEDITDEQLLTIIQEAKDGISLAQIPLVASNQGNFFS
ncbi:hypothetical protein [Niallia sp. Man26]|uniref:PTS sugar transporter subunit IIA n=1 Tax=Niallia sp. Man26 TaxID=2912824 RepID=UPI001EDBB053|nr:hypothetical protein [Niallia sp. Man26]UPO90131.1 hypothetical protein L8T27_025570 [Niallia sp. Man26]